MLPITLFQSYIVKHKLFNASDKILLAVSGGKDSVLMACFFKESGYNFAIAHCNFHLRGAESNRDEEFVRQLADKFNVELYIQHFETEKYASENNISTQMAARDLRYGWFEEIRSKYNFDYVALAQHQNDAIETLLINLVRGTGISGLHGILPKRDKWIRPLLFLNHEEIQRLIEKLDIDFVEDSSNSSTKYTRNKIRHLVVPQLKEINGNLENTFAQNIKRFTEIEQLLIKTVEKCKKEIFDFRADGIYLDIKKIRALDPISLLLFEMLKCFSFKETEIENLISALNGQSGKQFYSNTHKILVDRDFLIVNEIKEIDNYYYQIEKDAVDLQGPDFYLKFASLEEVIISKEINVIQVDYEKLVYPLIVRRWENGDRFKPFGMNGYKKVSDFFIDEKVQLDQKKQYPILINGNGEVIWICGMRLDNRYRITDSTKKVAIFEVKFSDGK